MLKRLFIMLLTAVAVVASAQDVPTVASFYPDSRTSVQKYSKSSVYVYFNTGSKIVSATGRVVQDDVTLGDVMYYGAKSPTYYATMKYADNQAVIDLIRPGEFTIDIVAVEYVVDGVNYTYAAEGEPLGSTTYLFPGENGKLVSETGLKNNTMLSYYKADSQDGVLSFTFSKAIDPSHLTIEFEFGIGDFPGTTPAPWVLTDDGKTIVIDLRGKAYDGKTLSNGKTFYDEQGNPVVPTSVSLVVNHLNCADGTTVTTETVSPDGQHTYTLSGRMHKTMQYRDLTHATPALESVEFYPAANPDDTHPAIVEGCDMMALTVADADVLARTDIQLATITDEATIAWTDIRRSGNILRAPLPQGLEAAGNLVISLVNYTFTVEDGLEHVIQPLSLGDVVKEVTTIAALKALEPGTEVVLNVRDGINVTYATDGYCFFEDDNDGLYVRTDGKVFNTCTRVSGKLYGKFGGVQFEIDAAKSRYSDVQANLTVGTKATVADIQAGLYDYRLVSFVNTKATPITVENGEIAIAGSIMCELDNGAGIQIPETVQDITGVVFYSPILNDRYIIVRQPSDINQELPNPDQPDPDDPDGIDSLGSSNDNFGNSPANLSNSPTTPIYTLDGMRVTQPIPARLYIQRGHKHIPTR